MQTPISCFTELTDPRVDRSKDHLMEDIIFTAIAAVICGAETWNDIEHYGKSKESWLKQYLQLPNVSLLTTPLIDFLVRWILTNLSRPSRHG
ncbi:Transposase [Bacteroidales bacterium Barb6]|nr:Transposase [Bacteroidales bacterium Barb6]